MIDPLGTHYALWVSNPFSGEQTDTPGSEGLIAAQPGSSDPSSPSVQVPPPTWMPESAQLPGPEPALEAGSVRSSAFRPRRRNLTLGLAVVAAACLAVTAVTAAVAYSALTRKPTAAQRSAAAAAAEVGRWRSWPAGKIFPARLSYSTDLLTDETASRVGISSGDSCAAAIDASLARSALRQDCQAGLRATYLDQLQGIVYTVGLLVFPSSRQAKSFLDGLPAAGHGPIPLHALAFAGTASARFGDPARQTATALSRGPFVILTAAGYADGRPAAVSAEPRPSIFAPAAQLVAQIAGPLTAPVAVSCDSRYWSC